MGDRAVDGLLAIPDDGWRYEVVDGVLVRIAGSGDLATTIAATIMVLGAPRQPGSAYLGSPTGLTHPRTGVLQSNQGVWRVGARRGVVALA